MLEKVPARNYVFRQGDPSNDKFYIIMQGSISVIVKHDKNVFNQEYFDRFGFDPATLHKKQRNSNLAGRRESKIIRGSNIDEMHVLALRPSVPVVSKPSNFSKR
jgi:CRP-like cAMP-binding protein